LMRRLDELHLEHPVYGSRKLRVLLRREGRWINRKRVVRLLRKGKGSVNGIVISPLIPGLRFGIQ